MLILPIKKKWFDMIASGEKKEEYREIKPYYDSRFMNAFGFILVGGQMIYGDAAPEEIRKPWPVPIVFRNGYSKESPEIICKCTLHFGKGKPEWGAEPGKLYYVLKIQDYACRRRQRATVCIGGRRMKQYTLNRKTYKDVKRMDHQQMDAFCKNLYKAGHADGMKDAEGLTENEVREVILGVKGIGPKKAEDIVNALTAAQKERS